MKRSKDCVPSQPPAERAIFGLVFPCQGESENAAGGNAATVGVVVSVEENSFARIVAGFDEEEGIVDVLSGDFETGIACGAEEENLAGGDGEIVAEGAGGIIEASARNSRLSAPILFCAGKFEGFGDDAMEGILLSGTGDAVDFGEHQAGDAMIVHGGMGDAMGGEAVLERFAGEEAVGTLDRGDEIDGLPDLLAVETFIGEMTAREKGEDAETGDAGLSMLEGGEGSIGFLPGSKKPEPIVDGLIELPPLSGIEDLTGNGRIARVRGVRLGKQRERECEEEQRGQAERSQE